TGIRAERKLEDGIEVVEAGFPVLVTVLPDLNRPRIPGLKQVIGAAKKEVRVLDASGLGLTGEQLAPRVESRGLRAPQSDRKQVRLSSVAELAQVIAAAVR
ncbi:MAG: electron transfer flavoprotein beta subunit/FixA family protein, partial [Bacillota bacterium]